MHSSVGFLSFSGVIFTASDLKKSAAEKTNFVCWLRMLLCFKANAIDNMKAKPQTELQLQQRNLSSNL